jgi:hypothetical protein
MSLKKTVQMGGISSTHWETQNVYIILVEESHVNRLLWQRKHRCGNSVPCSVFIGCGRRELG